MDGYIKAELIYKPGTTLSRGFGFVTFDSPENANKLLYKTVTFKDRILRFTEYVSNGDSPENKNICQTNDNDQLNNLIIVKNTGNMTREDIYNFFSTFGSIGKHFIVTDRNTGISKNYAVVEIIENDVYDCLLKIKDIEWKSTNLEISKWKSKKTNKSNKLITKNDLFNAFIAGKNLGMIEALKSSKKTVCYK